MHERSHWNYTPPFPICCWNIGPFEQIHTPVCSTTLQRWRRLQKKGRSSSPFCLAPPSLATRRCPPLASQRRTKRFSIATSDRELLDELHCLPLQKSLSSNSLTSEIEDEFFDSIRGLKESRLARTRAPINSHWNSIDRRDARRPRR